MCFTELVAVSNSVAFIETATNSVKHITYVGRSPHEAFFTPNGSEVWVTVRGENYVAVLDGHTYEEKTRIIVPGGPGMQILDRKSTRLNSSHTVISYAVFCLKKKTKKKKYK